MSLLGHIKILTDEQWALVEPVLKNAGHEEIVSVKSNTAKFLAKLESEFPEVYADIKKGIADLKDATMSGGDKAVKVATDIVATLPDVLKALPGIKDALVSGVTTFFADEISDFKNITEEVIAKL